MAVKYLGKKSIIEGLQEQRGDMHVTYPNIEKAWRKLGSASRISISPDSKSGQEDGVVTAFRQFSRRTGIVRVRE